MPLVQVVTIVSTVAIAKRINSESRPLLLGSIICTILMVIVSYFCDTFHGIAFGATVIILHSIYSGIINTCFWTCLVKNISKKIAPFATSFAAAGSSLPVFFYSFWIGLVLGEEGDKKKMLKCTSI